MKKKIDFLVVDNPYNSTYLFTKGIKKAFDDLGFSTRTLSFKEENIFSSLNQLLKSPPDLLFSFSYIYMQGDHLGINRKEMFLSTFLKVPQFTYLIDSPIFQMHLFSEPKNYCSVVDKSDFEGLKSLNKNILFLPHAVEREEKYLKEDKVFDIVMTASFLDYEERILSWKERFNSQTYKKLLFAFEQALQNKDKPLILSLEKAFEGSYEYPYNDLYFELEYCIKGQDRQELLSLLKDFPIHIFGMSTSKKTWEQKFKNHKHLFCHPPLTYKKSLEILKKAKIVLNSSPQFSQGSHERIFNALMSRSFVVTNFNSFIHQEFKENKGVIYFGKGAQTTSLQEKVLSALSNNCQEEVYEGVKILQQRHTWHNRAEEIISYLNDCKALNL
jgi:spore maturation protein CgeB